MMWRGRRANRGKGTGEGRERVKERVREGKGRKGEEVPL